MGEMTIKAVDEAVPLEPGSQADRHGAAPELYVRDLLRQALALRRGHRRATAKAILAARRLLDECEL